MDHADTRPLGTEAGTEAQDDGNKAIRTVLGMLSNEVAIETASFMVETSLQLYPLAMRGDPSTPAATSLREYHFAILMRNVLAAYAEGRGQDFADDRIAVHNLLQEEPEHQPLAERFCRLMGLWLQEAHDKRLQVGLERAQKRKREMEEEEMREEQERAFGKADDKANSKNKEWTPGKEGTRTSQDSSFWVDANEQNSDVDVQAQPSPSPVRAKDVFDLAGLVETDDEASVDDEASSSDEEYTTLDQEDVSELY